MEKYVPETAGPETDSVPKVLDFVQRELRRVSNSFEGTLSSELNELHVEPTKRRTGMIVLADGTDWNPGAGQGVYAYYNGAWNKLG